MKKSRPESNKRSGQTPRGEVVQTSRGAADTAKDISARNFSGTWSELAERYGQSILAWDDQALSADG